MLERFFRKKDPKLDLIRDAAGIAIIYARSLGFSEQLSLSQAQNGLLLTYFSGFVIRKGGSELSYRLGTPEMEIAKRDPRSVSKVREAERDLLNMDNASQALFHLGDLARSVMSEHPEAPYASLLPVIRESSLAEFYKVLSCAGHRDQPLGRLNLAGPIGSPDGILAHANALTHPILEYFDYGEMDNSQLPRVTDMQAVLVNISRERRRELGL